MVWESSGPWRSGKDDCLGSVFFIHSLQYFLFYSIESRVVRRIYGNIVDPSSGRDRKGMEEWKNGSIEAEVEIAIQPVFLMMIHDYVLVRQNRHSV